MDHEWTVVYMDGDDLTTERVTADAWQVGPNGDLAFFNGPYTDEPFYLRAFAAGTWTKVSLFA